MDDTQRNLSLINQWDEKKFVQHFGAVIEHSEWVAQEIYQQRPFSDMRSLHQAVVQVIQQRGHETWKQILCLHPELSGKEAKAGTLTSHSAKEQSGIGLDALTSKQFTHMQNFNRRYREKFGFPFVVCVRLLNSLEALFAEQERRIALSPQEELITGIEQVYAIARIRLESMLLVVSPE